MTRKFSSFLLRRWRGQEGERLEIEHIQSGRKLLTASLDDATRWMDAQESPEQRASDEMEEKKDV